jgi:putative hydroxymethylpyrimidine transport system permease protein
METPHAALRHFSRIRPVIASGLETSAAPMRLEQRMRDTGRVAGAVAAVLAILVLWQGMVGQFAIPAYLLPSPLAVARAFVEQPQFLARHAAITSGEMVLGLIAGAGAGIAAAVAIARHAWARRFLLPLIVTTQTLPVFAIAPLLVVWLGFGAASKVVMAAIILFFPVASALHDGLSRTDRNWLDAAHGWNARPAQTLLLIRIPAALPALASGLRIAAALAPIGAVVGEWAGAAGGLGYVMLQANARGQTDMVFACLIVLAACALALRAAVSAACDRIVFWQPRT